MPHPVDVHVGSKVRQLRVLKNMSQTALGNRLGISFQQIQKYEKGSNRVSSSRLWELSNIFDVPVEYFFDDLSKTSRNSDLPSKKSLATARDIDAINCDDLKTSLHQLVKVLKTTKMFAA